MGTRGGRGGAKGDYAKRMRMELQRGSRNGSTSGNDSEGTIGSRGSFKGSGSMGRTLFGPPPKPERIEEAIASMKKDPKYDAIQPFRRAGMFCPWYVKELLSFPGKVQAFKLINIYEKSLNDHAPEEEMDSQQLATEKSLAEKALFW